MVGGTKRPPQDSESGPWSHEQSNTKSNSNTKTFHEEESQNLSRVQVSLDNADTVIEGGPLKPAFGLSGDVPSRSDSISMRMSQPVAVLDQPPTVPL